MKIVTKKKTVGFAMFLLISGLGSLWLTFWWYNATLGNNSVGGHGEFSSFSVLYYYIFNSVMLILSGAILILGTVRPKYCKFHSVLAIILGISVTVSLFIFGDRSSGILSNLFISTTYLGMVAGAMYGGTILVPMFLSSVYIGAIRGVNHVRGNLNYSISEANEVSQDNLMNGVPATISFEKSILQKIIPIIGIVIGLFNGMNYWRFLFSGWLEVRGIVVALLPIILIILSIISLSSKNIKAYRILNIVIAILVLFPFLLTFISTLLGI